MNRILIAGPLLLTISGGVLYHLAAKSIPKGLNPSLVLVAAYATALITSLAAYALLPASPAPQSTRAWHPSVVILGIAAFLIELGYVVAYRTAWPIGTTSVVTSGMVAALLVPIGMSVFGERLSLANALGLVLCLTGLALLRR